METATGSTGGKGAGWYPQFVVLQPHVHTHGFTLYLPMPPPLNHSYIIARRGNSHTLIDHPDVTTWKGEADIWFDRQFDFSKVLRREYILDTEEDPHLFCHYHFAFSDHGGDIDGRIKKVQDFCNGRFFTDDKRVEGILCTRTRAEDMRWHEGMSPLIRMCQTDGIIPHVRLRLFNLADLHPVIDMENWKDCVV